MILETKRLILRRLEPQDALRMSIYRSKPEVAKYQSWNRYTQVDATKRIQQCLHVTTLNRPKTDYHLGIVLKEENVMVGDLFVHILNKKSLTLGYTFDSDYWSQGYATEMITAFCEYMKESYQFQNILCYVYNENIRSKMLLNKLGFRKFDESYFYQDEGYVKKL